MVKRLVFILIFITLLIDQAFTQNSANIEGKVTDENGDPLYLASILIDPHQLKTLSNEQGKFLIQVPSNEQIFLSVEYKGKITQTRSLSLTPGQQFKWDIILLTDTLVYDNVVISNKSKQSIDQRREVSSFKIDPKLPKYLPSAFNDFNKILATLPGVSSNSELTSQYSVRGGNYDENLIYVNDIEIYRPFLVRSGQQEGLSFINPDLVKEVEFSSGGWQARYGDKLSSVLSVKYKTPYKFKASGSASLLGGTLHAGGATKNERVSFVIGAREKSASYLLNTLPTKGEYKPRFFDIQSYLQFDLTKNRKEGAEPVTTLGILSSFARNMYLVSPTQSTTNFGTSSQALQLHVAYNGKETMEYQTVQTGIKLSHKHNDKVKADWIVSAVNSAEREYSDEEGIYKLSEIETDPNSSRFNQPIFTIGTGSLFNHTRNQLKVNILSFNHKGYYNQSNRSKFQWGFTQSHESIKDYLSEYSFIDSSGYVYINRLLNSSANLNSFRTQGYAQHSFEADSFHAVTYGLRFNYWTLNNQLLISPRIQYAWQPKWKDDILFKFSTGLYQQSPFYRELRDMNGVVHQNTKAQSSVHLIAGSDLKFKAWGRDFKFITEVYGKYLYNVIPYDVDNVRIRYYGVNNAKAYVVGTDFRISGEFVKDLESWFSLGVLSAKEDVSGDGKGFIRRPTDQRVTAAIFFQDHLPNNPSIKAYLNLVYGTGLPFGPPNSPTNRAVLSGPSYRRVDIGFSKLITYADREVDKKNLLESLWISLEVLNILGVNNTISYLWISDINRNQYAVPNTLSQRFLNLRIVANL